MTNSRVQDKSLQKSNLSAKQTSPKDPERTLVQNDSVNLSAEKSQPLNNSAQKSQSVNTSEARDVVNSLNSSERASRSKSFVYRCCCCVDDSFLMNKDEIQEDKLLQYPFHSFLKMINFAKSKGKQNNFRLIFCR